MEISRTTPLGFLISNGEVSSAVSDTTSGISSAIDDRGSLVTTALGDSSVTGYSVNGSNAVADALNTVNTNYGELSSQFGSLANLFQVAATTQEIKELNELINELGKAVQEYQGKLDECDQNIQNWEWQKSYCTQEDVSKFNGYIYAEHQKRKSFESSFTNYNDRLTKAQQRLSDVDTSFSGTPLYNVMASFEVGEDGRPTSLPRDFTLDSHHRLDTPGWGCFVEGSWGNDVEFHYNPGTNMFYYGDPGTDWNSYDYSSDCYGITPQEMYDSAVEGGICPG